VRTDAERHIAETCSANIRRFRQDKFRRVNQSSLSELFVSFLAKVIIFVMLSTISDQMFIYLESALFYNILLKFSLYLRLGWLLWHYIYFIIFVFISFFVCGSFLTLNPRPQGKKFVPIPEIGRTKGVIEIRYL
jgi:hypothetical protein